MIKAALKLGAIAAVAAIAAAVALGWRDIKRFVQIKQVSGASRHPEKVPVAGRTAYPRTHAAGQPDGTGDFDSALRGGPIPQ